MLVPALGKLLKADPYGLSPTAYGALFVPEIGGAIVAALLAGPLDRHLGAHGLFRVGLGCNALAMALLAVSRAFAGGPAAYVLLLAETAFLGLGFGFVQSVINGFAVELFPDKRTVAVTALNAVIGGATAASPLIVDALLQLWWLWPLALGSGFVAADAASWFAALPHGDRNRAAALRRWRMALLFMAAVFVYAVIEGTFSSWAVVYLTGTHHAAEVYAAAALAGFWGTLTLVRFVVSTIPDRWVSPRLFYLACAPAMAACFIAVALAGKPAALVALYAAAGGACGVFYPFSMAFALAAYPQSGTRIAGLLVAALMVGEGVGSYLPGGLQHWLGLGVIYAGSALWTLPLLGLAWFASRRAVS